MLRETVCYNRVSIQPLKKASLQLEYIQIIYEHFEEFFTQFPTFLTVCQTR